MEDDGDDKDDTKRKSRNLSEKKRRDQFNSLVNDLSALISTSNRKMDKSTVLKSTIAFLKHHNEAADRSKIFEIQQDWKPSFLTNDEFTHLMLESLDGFIIVFSSNGTIYYASESITSLLGYLPSDILSKSIYDMVYAKDHESLFNIFLNPKPVIEHLQTDINASNQITFFVYLKRGNSDKKGVTLYELVKFVGYFRNNVNLEDLPSQSTHTLPEIFRMKSNTELDSKLIFVGTGRVQTPQLTREMCTIGALRSEFTSKHSMEWKFLFLDQRAPPIIGYMPFEVLGTSGYDYYHFDDLDNIVECHEKLIRKGEEKSCYYRFLTKGQQWIWLQTDYYVSYHQYNGKPDYVVCNHRVVSYEDVLNENKSDPESKNIVTETSNANNSPTKSCLPTRKRFDACNTGTFESSPALGNPADGGNPVTLTVGAILCEASPIALETSNTWAGLSSSSRTPMTPPHKSSRPASSYGNISSAGISPTVKRKRYLHPNRGNESDSTSISAESVTSRHSLLTHISSGRQRHNTSVHTLHQQLQQHQHQTNQPSQQLHVPQLQSLGSPTIHVLDPIHQSTIQSTVQQSSIQIGPTVTAQQKVIPVLPQHAVTQPQMHPNSTCQFSQTTFPLHSSQIVGSSFLEPPQYLTAIPVQPVISPFQVAPVLSPLPVSTATLSGRLQPTQHEPTQDMIPSGVVMTPTQTQLQDRLQRKHDELQKLIIQQQDELRIVSEQLLLARYTILQPMMPMSYNSLSQNGRSYNLNNNTIEPQFNQYGFALNSEQMQNNQDQQMMIQQQQNLHMQQQNIQRHQQHSQPLHQQSQMQNQSSHMSHLLQQTQSQQHQQQHQQQQQQHLMRSIHEFDPFAQEDIDAFLNLSPLHTLSTHTPLNQITGPNNRQSINTNTNNTNTGTQDNNAANLSSIPNNNNNTTTNANYVTGMDVGVPHASNDLTVRESTAMTGTTADPLLSYIQMATQNNFRMAISDDGSETQSEDTKAIQQQQQQHASNHQQLQPQIQTQTQQPQTTQRSYFSANPFETLSNTEVGEQLPNDLEILQYQMSQEQSQSLFDSSTQPGGR